MQTVTNGFALNPSALLETAFQAIADGGMQDLPFSQPKIPVRACGFQLFERQWIGTLLTPWMLSLLVLPGPEQQWPPRAVGDKLALSLPCGSVRFIVGEVEDCGQYLACSLMSPLDRHLGAEQALVLAQQSAQMALSLPVADGNIPSNPGRRALFRLPQGTA